MPHRTGRYGWIDPKQWRGLIVVCSGMSWEGPWMSHKHIATRLTAYAPVLFVDPPLSALRAIRDSQRRSALSEARLVPVGPRLARLTPLAPPGVSRRGLRDVAQPLARQQLARAVRRLGGEAHAVIVGSFDNFFGACGERLRVMYGTDDFAAGGALMNLPHDWLLRQESAQLRRANRVVAVSQPLVRRWRGMGHQVTFIPNGCDARRYATTDDAILPDDVRLPRPIAGVVGHLSARIDLDYLEAVASTEVSLLLVGPLDAGFEPDRMRRLFARPNVMWVGAKPFDAMPSYLRAMKVGLTPYGTARFNQASFPLKTLEYMAAGRAAISTDLPAARWLDTDLLAIGRTPAEFAQLTVNALHAPDDKEIIGRRRAFAATHSWDARARDFARLLGLT